MQALYNCYPQVSTLGLFHLLLERSSSHGAPFYSFPPQLRLIFFHWDSLLTQDGSQDGSFVEGRGDLRRVKSFQDYTAWNLEAFKIYWWSWEEKRVTEEGRKEGGREGKKRRREPFPFLQRGRQFISVQYWSSVLFVFLNLFFLFFSFALPSMTFFLFSSVTAKLSYGLSSQPVCLNNNSSHL